MSVLPFVDFVGQGTNREPGGRVLVHVRVAVEEVVAVALRGLPLETSRQGKPWQGGHDDCSISKYFPILEKLRMETTVDRHLGGVLIIHALDVGMEIPYVAHERRGLRPQPRGQVPAAER